MDSVGGTMAFTFPRRSSLSAEFSRTFIVNQPRFAIPPLFPYDMTMRKLPSPRCHRVFEATLCGVLASTAGDTSALADRDSRRNSYNAKKVACSW